MVRCEVRACAREKEEMGGESFDEWWDQQLVLYIHTFLG